jgi:hypothetical protein
MGKSAHDNLDYVSEEADSRFSLPSINETGSDFENWRFGAHLSEAPWLWADNAARNEFRASGRNRNPADWLQAEFERDTLEGLLNGDLIGFGVPMPPAPAEPVRIPPAYFAAGVSEIDFLRAALERGRDGFVQITVLRCSGQVSQAIIPQTDPPKSTTPNIGAKRGRNPYTPMFAAALSSALSQYPDFLDWVQEKQAHELRDRVAAENSAKFQKNARPAKSTAIAFLKSLPTSQSEISE